MYCFRYQWDNEVQKSRKPGFIKESFKLKLGQVLHDVSATFFISPLFTHTSCKILAISRMGLNSDYKELKQQADLIKLCDRCVWTPTESSRWERNKSDNNFPQHCRSPGRVCKSGFTDWICNWSRSVLPPPLLLWVPPASTQPIKYAVTAGLMTHTSCYSNAGLPPREHVMHVKWFSDARSLSLRLTLLHS